MCAASESGTSGKKGEGNSLLDEDQWKVTRAASLWALSPDSEGAKEEEDEEDDWASSSNEGLQALFDEDEEVMNHMCRYMYIRCK